MDLNDMRVRLVLMGVGVLLLIIAIAVVIGLLGRLLSGRSVRRRAGRMRARRPQPPAAAPQVAPAAPPPPPAPAAPPVVEPRSKVVIVPGNVSGATIPQASSRTYVYDKAKYHVASLDEGLPASRVFVPTGLFLLWLTERGLVSDFFRAESEDWWDDIKARAVEPWELYEGWDGSLVDDMLSDEGNAFARRYYDYDQGGVYNGDFEEILAADLPSLFHVEGTWADYDQLVPRMDARLNAWRRKRAGG